MSTEKYDRYKELYSKYIDHAVIVHNYHYAFLRTLGKESGVNVRRSLTTMVVLEKELRRLSLEVFKENQVNIKEGRRRKREELIKIKKAGPGRGRPRTKEVKIKRSRKGRPRKDEVLKNDNINTTN
jgi:hypothetical protein